MLPDMGDVSLFYARLAQYYFCDQGFDVLVVDRRGRKISERPSENGIPSLGNYVDYYCTDLVDIISSLKDQKSYRHIFALGSSFKGQNEFTRLGN